MILYKESVLSGERQTALISLTMKTSIIFIITTICSFFGRICILSAQDIKGVAIRTTMTKNEVIAKFGVPGQYSYSDARDFGVDER